MNYHHDTPTTIHTPSSPDPIFRHEGHTTTRLVTYKLGRHVRVREIPVISTTPPPAFSPVPADWGVTTTISINGKRTTVRCQPA